MNRRKHLKRFLSHDEMQRLGAVLAKESASEQLHDLRHNFASHAAMNKETLPMIGRLLGHTRVQSSARCAHLDDEHVLEAAEQIGSAPTLAQA